MWEDAEDKQLHYFEIHVHTNESVVGGSPLALLYVQLSDSKSEPKVPPFLSVREEVTNEPEYSAKHLALLTKT